MLYLISYDLIKPEKDYPSLTGALERDGAIRILYSEWLVRLNISDAIDVAKRYLAYMDQNDSLFVVEVTKNSAWLNLKNESVATTWLQDWDVRRAA